MKYAKLMFQDIADSSRDKRELATAADRGWQILLLSPRPNMKPYPAGAEVQVLPSLEVSARVPRLLRYLRIVRNWLGYVRAVSRVETDVLSCHDLPALRIGYVQNLLRAPARRVKLVYDAHEFEIGRNTNGKRGRLATWRIKQEEGFLMKRCAFSIVVNDSIADAVQQIHHLQQRPVVVRSTPRLSVRDEAAIAANRRAMLEALPGAEYLMMFHGNLVTARGIPDLIRAAARFPDVGLVLMGAQSDRKFAEELRQLAETCGVSDRVLFHPAVPAERLPDYIGAVDLELMPIEPVVRSHYYVLPNKFFESVQAEVPIVASDLPEMRRLIDRYEIGLCCQPNDVDDLCRCIETMRSDPAFYARCRENLKVAKQDLCWEKERNVLEQAFATL